MRVKVGKKQTKCWRNLKLEWESSVLILDRSISSIFTVSRDVTGLTFIGRLPLETKNNIPCGGNLWETNIASLKTSARLTLGTISTQQFTVALARNCPERFHRPFSQPSSLQTHIGSGYESCFISLKTKKMNITCENVSNGKSYMRM